MCPSRRGSGVARLALLSLAAVVVGCSANPATGALKVEVALEPGLVSRCVKVTATDGMVTSETSAIPLAGKGSSLDIGIAANGLGQPVTVQALGFSDEACTTRTPGEESETKSGELTRPPSTVTLTLRPVTNGDGGFDGGPGDGGADAGMDAGVDGGMDAGVDNDFDNYPDSVDCNDNDPTVNPGMLEVCSNTKDDDCNMQVDCLQSSCAGMGCAGNGTCIGTICVAMTEAVCNDGVDNNNNGLIDCADSDCPPGRTCNDNNVCTQNDVCVSGNSCGSTPFNCTSPPAPQQCWNGGGICVPDGGAPTCQYTPTVGNMCNDGLACTMGEMCSNGACVGGTMMPCTSPPGACFATTGTCQEPAATCTYAPLAAGTGTCSDSNNCTTGDRCAGDGGCAGTAVTCTSPNQCQNASTSCEVDGGCIYPPRTGQACDAGTGAGTCDGTASCVLTPPTLFPTPPSNFNESQLPADAGTAFAITCATTINTTTLSISSGCGAVMPPHAVITQTTGGEQALLIRVPSLTVNSSQILTLTGSRPVIFAVLGDVSISGTIRANNPGSPAGCGNGGNGGATAGLGGGGGGGFSSAGGAGGVRTAGGAGTAGGPNGLATLAPLRGGCQGGNGSGTGGAGASGGGAIQIVASGNLTLTSSGIVTAQGKGGAGGTGTDSSGGGGGSGGGILLEATIISLNSNSWVSANGGGGGGGEDMSTSGGNGADGAENSLTGANGGGGASAAGEGGDGATRTSAVQNGFNTTDNDGAGGGGGGLGRIRLNGRTNCAIDGAANFSPALSGNGVGNCPVP